MPNTIELPYTIEPPFYPIVYVRGFAPDINVASVHPIEANFNDAYYGFADTSVDKRQVVPGDGETKPSYVPDVFEGQLIRLLKEHSYTDAFNDGLNLATANRTTNPTRSIWISRFYDTDYFQGRIRSIEDHAEDLRQLICVDIPQRWQQLKQDDGTPLVDLGPNNENYKVILIAHSMGGLICRTLIQNLLKDPKLNPSTNPTRWIHRLVTLGTPHRGIDLDAIPEFLQNFTVNTFNPFDASMFKQERMQAYLKLSNGEALNSLGDSGFPPDRCLCIIGSDYKSYSLVQKITGGYSDGLVKQDHAFIQGAYTANVHRAHSGYRGIVNSFESYHNIHRFLFGDAKVTVTLTDIQVHTDPSPDGGVDFYNFEFSESIRNTGVYVHLRRAEPCENAIVFKRDELPTELPLHTGFLNSALRADPNEQFLYFALSLRVSEHRVSGANIVQGLWDKLWDKSYPDRAIYSETLELRVGMPTATDPYPPVEYRWMSDAQHNNDEWKSTQRGTDNIYRFTLRNSEAFGANLSLTPTDWPASY